ncbi:hypothetical protein OG308_24040 [Nocardia salmonicida]|uniref:Transposase n=1 Tax=Nocardia salmonicida TaxID=53431 RepID=A0ABZ1N360_9NOCA
MSDEAWFPSGRDVHLRIWLGGLAVDYRATLVAALNFMRDGQRNRWCAIEFISHPTSGCPALPRLPCERLFLGP